MVEVPPADPPPEEQQPPPPPPTSQQFSTSSGAGSSRDPPARQEVFDKSKYRNLEIPSFRGSKDPARAPAPAEWAPASSLFAMGPSHRYGDVAGDFLVGQLVQARPPPPQPRRTREYECGHNACGMLASCGHALSRRHAPEPRLHVLARR